MNKKITAVTLTALMVLTMFTALVPTASAAIEVAAPYEFMAAVNTSTDYHFEFDLTSANNPSVLYFDLEDKTGEETLDIYSGYLPSEDKLTIGKYNLTYTTNLWEDPDTTGDYYIAWMGAKHFVVDNGTGDWIISAKIVDEDDTDDHLLRVGESLSLGEGFALTALEIDVDGHEAWFSLTKDGEEIDNEVVAEGDYFVYKKDLGADDKTVVMNFTVDVVFAGMNTNLVKINDVDLISVDVVEIDDNDEDLMDDYKVKTEATSIEIENTEDLSLGSDSVTDIMDGRFGIRVNEDDDYAAVVRVITEPGTYELMAAVNTTDIYHFEFDLTSANNPSLLYFDLEDKTGEETLNISSGHLNSSEDELTIGKYNLTYTTNLWEDPDTTGDYYIAWMGAKHFVVDNGTGDWIISAKIVDEDDTDDHLLRVGESLSLGEGFALTALEIDVDGHEAWFSLTKDGEEIDNEVVAEGDYFVYKKDLGADDKTVVMNFTVDVVFAGMNTNLVKINDVDLISVDVVEIDDNDEDLMDDYKVKTEATSIEIENTEDLSLGSDSLTDIMDGRFGIRVNEDDDYAAVVQTVIVGGGAAATPTEDLTVEPTVEPTEAATDGAATAAPTAAGTAAATAEVPTPEPTKEPGFEAVFAVAGLLAVAYLVLRQRE